MPVRHVWNATVFEVAEWSVHTEPTKQRPIGKRVFKFIR
jgi:hypothetical protein